MRDNHYRNLCTDPKEYDRTIDWVKQHINNKGCNCQHDHAEEVASSEVNACIHSVIYDGNNLRKSEWCVGMRAPNKRKVILKRLMVLADFKVLFKVE